MENTLVMLLAGGMGSRLGVLASPRAKPAVPFAGSFRIIDFALSNVMNARLGRVGVLTQYRPGSLIRHIGNGMSWDLWGKNSGIRVLPPFLGQEESDWYKGTADAIYQNLFYVERYQPRRLLILCGDHIYHMAYREMLDYHEQKHADLTVAAMVVPWEEASRFGLMEVDAAHRIVAFQEKPKVPRSNLASMGIYVFNTETLVPFLHEGLALGMTDFGQHIIPAMFNRGMRIFSYPFHGYWRDVGTVHSYWAAHMDLFDPHSGLDMAEWKVRTNSESDGVERLPPMKFAATAQMRDAIVGRGCFVAGTVERSVLSPGVTIARGALVRDSVVMHGCRIGAGATVERVVMDKQVVVGEQAAVGTSKEAPVNERHPDKLNTGLTVLGKRARIPQGVRIGGNCLVHPEVSEADFASLVIADGATVGQSY